MSYQIVDPLDIAGAGPHPAASPFDKRLTIQLALTAFEVYQVELPAGEETIAHTHVADGMEDMYAVVRGEGWLIVDGEPMAVRPGQFMAVTVESTRHLQAGPQGLTFIAVCSGGTSQTDRQHLGFERTDAGESRESIDDRGLLF